MRRKSACVTLSPAAQHYDDRLIAKLFTYSSGFAGSKVLPITTKLLLVAAGGVRPTSFISLVVSVARNTCLATARVVDVALDLAPALHLREDPHREGLVRERIEVDAVRVLLHGAEAVREGAGENLLQHRHRLVDVVRGRDGLGDCFPVLGFR